MFKKIISSAILVLAIFLPVLAQRVKTVVSPNNFAGDAITLDGRGNVYGSDFDGLNGQGGGAIIKVTPFGERSVYATGFDGPAGSAFDRAGNLFVANFYSGIISKVAPDGTVSVFAGGLNGPVSVVIDETGNLYVTEAGIGQNPGRKISKINASGVVSTFVDFAVVDSSFLALGGLDRDEDGNFYVSNFINGKIKKVTPAGVATDFVTIPGNISFETGPLGYLTYSCGNIYVTYIGGNVIYKISRSGAVTVFAGTGQPGVMDGRVEVAQFNGPNGIAASRFGAILYVTDFGSNSLRRIVGVRAAN